MKHLLFLFMSLIMSLECYTQSETFNLEDYQWLHDLESTENLEWVEARKIEALNYFSTIELLSSLESWKKSYLSAKKNNFLVRVPPAVIYRFISKELFVEFPNL